MTRIPDMKTSRTEAAKEIGQYYPGTATPSPGGVGETDLHGPGESGLEAGVLDPKHRPVQVWGLGLMGLSLASGLREQGFTVFGRDQNPEAEAFASEQGVHIGVVQDPGWCVIAVPPDAVDAALADAWPHLGADTVVTDLTSVKGSVLPRLAELPPTMPVVSSHPMAGNEQGGRLHFRPDLFRDRLWALIPVPGHPVPWGAMATLVGPLGVQLTVVEGDHHDRIAAITSHLPYVSALALSSLLGSLPDEGRGLLGPGFLGATRTAQAPSALWTEILLANREPVSDALRALRRELRGWERALRFGSGSDLRRRIEAVRVRRRALSGG